MDVAAVDLQVAVTLLRMCGSFCRMVHIARVTPPSLASDALSSFDEEVNQYFTICSAINVTDDAWSQAQLGPKFGGLGPRSLSHHAAAAFIVSLSFSGLGSADSIHLQQAVAVFNTLVSLSNAISVNSVQVSPIPQKVLSGMIQARRFHILLGSSSPANRARLLLVAAPHASSWLSFLPLVWACTWSGMSTRWPLGSSWGWILLVGRCAHSALILLLILLVTML